MTASGLTPQRDGSTDRGKEFYDNKESVDSAKTHAEPGAPTPPSPLLWVTLLSLDAPAVAVLWQRLFARCFQVRLEGSVTLLLALVVWLIYVADRFLDTLAAPARDTEAVRHNFYRRRRWAFALPFFAAFGLACWLALTRIDPRTFRDGLIILLAVGVYFFLVHLRKPERHVPKEMLVGILFGLGTCFPAWEELRSGRIELLAPFAVFTVLCWLNCAAIESSEWARLRHYRFGRPHPWTIWLGRRMTLVAGATALGAAGILLAGGGNWRLPVAEILSAGAFVLLDFWGEKISLEIFRVLMDVALFTPLLILAFWVVGAGL